MNFKYDHLSWKLEDAPTPERFSKGQYGAASYWGTIWHDRGDGTYDISYDGQTIFQVGPGKATFIVVPDDPYGYGWKTRINKALLGTDLDVLMYKKKRANGTVEWTLKFYGQRKGLVKTVTCRERVQLTDEQGNLVLEPAEDNIDVSKDNAKYRAFNKELKRLKGVLCAQIKLNGYQWVGSNTDFETPERIAEFKSLFPYVRPENDPNFKRRAFWIMRGSLNDSTQYNAVSAWVNNEDRSPENVKRIMWTILFNHYPLYRYGQQPYDAALQQRCVINGLRAVQIRFLRENCVTISESKNTLGSSNDARQNEDSQLLPPDRLREVQVPCEAEVC